MSIASCGLGRDDLPARVLYSPREAQALLGISHATLYRLIAAAKLDARKLGNKTLITADSIAQLIAELPPAQVRSA
jgi:excisionase family DNA binding protein